MVAIFRFWCCISALRLISSTYLLANARHFQFRLILPFASIRTDPTLYSLHDGHRFAFDFCATVHMCDSGNASHHRCCPSLSIAFRPHFSERRSALCVVFLHKGTQFELSHQFSPPFTRCHFLHNGIGVALHVRTTVHMFGSANPNLVILNCISCTRVAISHPDCIPV